MVTDWKGTHLHTAESKRRRSAKREQKGASRVRAGGGAAAHLLNPQGPSHKVEEAQMLPKARSKTGAALHFCSGPYWRPRRQNNELRGIRIRRGGVKL